MTIGAGEMKLLRVIAVYEVGVTVDIELLLLDVSLIDSIISSSILSSSVIDSSDSSSYSSALKSLSRSLIGT